MPSQATLVSVLFAVEVVVMGTIVLAWDFHGSIAVLPLVLLFGFLLYANFSEL